ncbi:hypothetical protein EDF56_105203 [Novosphingobium sp. PhB165]|jgi:hypothetical protein|uniref:hypothetical protein n=1 Tax=Novosphingobium sp. PhB165 TaxID=2485105 RepID=UPI00104FF8AC|nr:hypothetical protein [Novosphingobium sp. PhB165]TCM17859.1 hypothetical protein EDF56_105203 [Novosphingobium sp. PhB165]
MTIMRKIGLTGALAATALAAATPAMAQDYRRGGDNTAAVAIGAGVIGLALGAIVASGNDHYRDYPGYAYGTAYGPSWSSWEYRDGWYYDHDGRRHSRDEYARYQRNDRPDARRGYDHDRGDFRRGY